MNRCNELLRRWGIAVISVIISACGYSSAQEGDVAKNPLKVPQVTHDKYGLFSVADCPTVHDELTVELEMGEFSINQVRIFTDGMMMQSIPISEEDAIVRPIVHFMDANFDGNVDILIGPGTNREYSVLFLWDNEESRFSRATVDGFNVFNGDFYYDPERMVVYRMTSSSAFETTMTMMVWQGSDLQSEETFLQVSDASYYDFYHVTHRYTVRGYYSGDDIISTDDPKDISEPWNRWLVNTPDD